MRPELVPVLILVASLIGTCVAQQNVTNPSGSQQQQQPVPLDTLAQILQRLQAIEKQQAAQTNASQDQALQLQESIKQLQAVRDLYTADLDYRFDIPEGTISVEGLKQGIAEQRARNKADAKQRRDLLIGILIAIPVVAILMYACTFIKKGQ